MTLVLHAELGPWKPDLYMTDVVQDLSAERNFLEHNFDDNMMYCYFTDLLIWFVKEMRIEGS